VVVRRVTHVLRTTSFRQICRRWCLGCWFLMVLCILLVVFLVFATGSAFSSSAIVFFVTVLLLFRFGFFCGPTQSGSGSFLLVCCGSVSHGFGSERRWMWWCCGGFALVVEMLFTNLMVMWWWFVWRSLCGGGDVVVVCRWWLSLVGGDSGNGGAHGCWCGDLLWIGGERWLLEVCLFLRLFSWLSH